MYYLTRFFGIVFVVSFVVFLVTSNVRWAFNTLSLYEFGFSRHQVAEATDLTPGQLSEAAEQVRDYFNSSDGLLHVSVTFAGASIDDSATMDLYTEREIFHMRDVKELLWKTYRVQEGVFLYLLLFTALGFFIQGNDFAGRLRRYIVQGSVLTVSLVALFGLASLVNFGPIFVLFHEAGFSNDLWQLDPRTSYLVQMFPLGFWQEATILIGLVSIGESAGVVVLLLLIQWWQQWRWRVAQRKIPQFV